MFIRLIPMLLALLLLLGQLRKKHSVVYGVECRRTLRSRSES